MGDFIEIVEVFEMHALEYDRWFEENKFVYESEILALKRLISEKRGLGLEVGVGTGRFAAPLGIEVGVEPAKAMAKIAKKRGIEVYMAKAEELPFKDFSFEVVLMVVTICFVQDPLKALREAKRVLRSGGYLVVGIVDRESFLGRIYEAKKEKSVFYKNARFYSAGEVLRWLKDLGFEKIEICQTIFDHPERINALEPLKGGYGEGGFVAILAKK